MRRHQTMMILGVPNVVVLKLGDIDIQAARIDEHVGNEEITISLKQEKCDATFSKPVGR